MAARHDTLRVRMVSALQGRTRTRSAARRGARAGAGPRDCAAAAARTGQSLSRWACLPIEPGLGILTPVRALRRHIVVRIVACLLLTWAAADLLVPELCSAEAAVQDDESAPTSQDPDDCFCCCSHTEKAIAVTVAFSDGIPAVVERFPAENLAAGIPRSLYHPPLVS